MQCGGPHALVGALISAATLAKASARPEQLPPAALDVLEARCQLERDAARSVAGSPQRVLRSRTLTFQALEAQQVAGRTGDRTGVGDASGRAKDVSKSTGIEASVGSIVEAQMDGDVADVEVDNKEDDWSLTADSVMRCIEDFTNEMNYYIGASGIEFELQGDPAMFAISYGNCRSVAGRLVRVRADIVLFLSRIFDDPDLGLAEDHNFQSIHEYYTKKVPQMDLDKVLHGLSLCVPRSCDSRQHIRRILLAYWSCLANENCLGLERAPLPVMGLDLNVTFVADCSAHPDLLPGSRCGEHCRIPWWLGCAGQFSQRKSEWRKWGRQVREWQLAPTNRTLKEVAVSEADRLAEDHWRGALQWTSWVVSYTSSTCGSEHSHFAQQPPRLLDWEAIDFWKQERKFCPHGYAAALALRAARRSEAGLTSSAAQDLRTARAVLGGCQDLQEMEYRACAKALRPVWGEAEAAEASGCSDQLLRYSSRLLQALMLE